MRRFELSDGKSHKFWQAECSGTELSVQFGRIGTNGQSQTKSFATGSAAENELDKLIKEKLKKGYSEVGAHDSVSVPAPPTPAPLTPAPTPDQPKTPAKRPAESGAATTREELAVRNGIAWTPTALRGAAPIRGSDLVTARAPDAKALFSGLKKAMDSAQAFLDTGALQSNAKVELMKAARAAFSGDMPAELSLETQAAAWALVGPPLKYGDKNRVDDFVRFWLAKAGGLFALRACLSAMSYNVEATISSVALVDQSVDPVWWRARSEAPWRSLRQVVATASDAEHGELLAEAERVRAGVPVEQRALLAAAFERAQWSAGDVAHASADQRANWFWPLLVSADTVQEAKALLDARGANPWETATAIDEISVDLLARYGEKAAPLLREVIEHAPAGADRLRSLAESLAMIVSNDVASFFVGQLDNKDLRGIASEYLRTHIGVSLSPLAAAAVAKGASAEMARSVLRTVTGSGASELDALSAALPADLRQLVEELRGAATAHEEASISELPAVLASPPWRMQRKAAERIVLELETLEHAESMEWKPGEAETLLNARSWLSEVPDRVKENLEEILAASASAPKAGERSWDMKNASLLARLPRQALIEILPVLNVERFSWSYYGTLSVLVARHGVAMIPLALRCGAMDPVDAVEALKRARSARVAPLMADAFARLKKARAGASEWLESFPETAAVGLIPQALSKPGKARDAAEMALRFVAGRGHRDTVEQIARRYGSEAEKGVAAVLDFDPLQLFPTKIPKLPAFFAVGALSRPLLNGDAKALPVAAVEALAEMLAFSTLEEPYAGIARAKQALSARSVAAFAWDLFQAWLAAGASSKEQWAFLALGHLGDDESARRLTPLIRAWPGEGGHARAVTGLDVLAHIGTDVALMHLHGIAQKLKFKGLQERARDKIAHVAESRGLTTDELADRLVPDLDLDENGVLVLDFGPRSFKVTFDETLKPWVMDDAGKRLPDLPKPRQTDDADASKLATEKWKAIKKDARTIASAQLLRLELAMCGERRWSIAVFRQFLLGHPLLIHVVRRLVWGVYTDGGLTATFRVAEDKTLADADDNTFELEDGREVGIVHALALPKDVLAAWGRILSDYEILQPFAQLSREVSAPTAEERESTELARVKGLKLPTGKVLGLDQRGWRRGPPQDAGVVCWYEKPLPDGLVACMELDPGIYTGVISESPEQTLGTVTLHKGEYSWQNTSRVSLGTLSAIAFSELARDLDSLRS